MRHVALVAGLVMAGALLGAQSPVAPPAQQAPLFRGGTLVVPLDVRVLDRNGKPITDLTAADFTLTEDKVPQRITQFLPQAHAPGAPSKLTMGDRFMNLGGPAPPTRRVFLIVLGRGRLQPPAKGVDGAIHLVRDLLLPQDHVAVLAWDRATDFTIDHARALAVLERFKARHEDIESKIRQAMSGLAGVYGSREFPASLRGQIDDVFAVNGAAAARAVPDATVPNARLAAAERRAVDALQRAEVIAGRENVLSEAVSPVEAAGLPLTTTFDEYVESNVQSMQDLSRIYRGIEYLKYLDGEKHLLFLSPFGITLPSAEDDRSLAATAADARVVIDIIHTGGVAGSGFNWAASTARTVTELTGGYFTGVSYATKAVERVDTMTRFSYLLGYSPTNTTWDLKYRRVSVKVNRPGATIHYRRGYFGREARPPMDAAAILSLTRISAATRFADAVTDIALKDVTASPATGPSGAREVVIEMMVSGSRLTFGEEGDRRTAKIDLAVFVGDERELLIGQTWQTIELKVDRERYERYLRDGIPITLRLAIRRSASYAKVVVYDYGSDLLGSAQVKVKKKK